MLKINNLTCQKGYNQLFSDLSFYLKVGEIGRIIGKNGSGKTSLLKILAGINKANAGEVFFNELTVDNEGYKAQVLYLGHQSLINGQLSTNENLRFLHSLNNDNPIDYQKALAKFGLKNYQDEYCYLLSAGQKRRVILASLVLSTQKIWLLDEPFTALDSGGIKLVEVLIKQHCEQGGVCIFTTHQTSILQATKIAL